MQLFFLQTVVLVLLATLHLTALHFALYWHYVWLDTVAHFLGGLWAVLFVAWIAVSLGKKPHILGLIAMLSLIALGWEVFELWAGVPREANFALDTSIDLLMDMLGGVVGLVVVGFLDE